MILPKANCVELEPGPSESCAVYNGTMKAQYLGSEANDTTLKTFVQDYFLDGMYDAVDSDYQIQYLGMALSDVTVLDPVTSSITNATAQNTTTSSNTGSIDHSETASTFMTNGIAETSDDPAIEGENVSSSTDV